MRKDACQMPVRIPRGTLLGPVTFATVEVPPNVPGSVTNPVAGRTYPYECASVLLQHVPYTDESTVTICGGSDSGGNALDNCVFIHPEATNPAPLASWVIRVERMTCDALHGRTPGWHGVAGFDGADDPNLSALLYDTSQPVGERISILNTTTNARMYHSEATLLPDGRVLVTGSDPNLYGAKRKFPEELRTETKLTGNARLQANQRAQSKPICLVDLRGTCAKFLAYLNKGLAQPVVTIPKTDLAYSGGYQIMVR
ncbi:hypothetical protein EDB89DRAFT_1910294 [Lactarius sanguifluus]|nr:hypothetical protein EDB89DRAFT_1910294 [Lactarius sanguifluus]